MITVDEVIPHASTLSVGFLAGIRIGRGNKARYYWLRPGDVAGQWRLDREDVHSDGCRIGARYQVTLSPAGPFADRCTCPGSEFHRSDRGSGCKHTVAVRRYLEQLHRRSAA